jgi:hypothetical protein
MIFYKNISKIEEVLEYLLLDDIGSDEIYNMLDILNQLKYVSERLTTFIGCINQESPFVDIKDIIEFLYLEYYLIQLNLLKATLDSFKEEAPYYPRLENLLNEIQNLIENVNTEKKNERFLF